MSAYQCLSMAKDLRDYRIVLKNDNGESGELEVYAENLYLAKQQAEHDANAGCLRGTGWQSMYEKVKR